MAVACIIIARYWSSPHLMIKWDRGVSIIMSEESTIHQCQMPNCGYIYNSERGCKKSKVPKDVPFEELPDTWRCPLCGANKTMFKPM